MYIAFDNGKLPVLFIRTCRIVLEYQLFCGLNARSSDKIVHLIIFFCSLPLIVGKFAAR